MSNMTLLTLESTQPTDKKALSGSFDDSSKESSLLFSDVMEKHKGQAQSGNSVTTNGKNEEHSCANEKSHGENEINNYASEDKSEEIQSKNSTDTELTAKTKNEEQDKNLSETEVVDPESTQSSKEQATTQPDQLLSFLNASEKVLNTQNNTVSASSEMATDEAVSNISNINKERNSANAPNKNVGDSPEAKEDANTLKTDKTLIAQSVSSQVETEDSDILQKVKALLKSKETESTNTSFKNTFETSVKNSAEADVKGIEGEVDSNDSAENIDKKVSPEMLVQSGVAKTLVEENSISIEKEGPAILDAKVNGKSENVSDSKNGTVNNAAHPKPELVDNVIEKNLNVVTAAEKAGTNPDQVIAQSKFQTLPKDTNKIDNNEKESKNIQASSELSEEFIDTASGDDSIISTKNNAIKNIIGEKSQVEQNKSTAQSSAATIESELQTETESTEESVVDEIMNNESKPLNSNAKLNSGINPLFDTLSQRDVNHISQGEERFIEHELSFENTMQNISADLAQTQKTAIIQQAETISIMRKDFTDAVKDKVMVMINQKIQQVDIQLDPPELGRMQVRINLQSEQAVVNFVVQNQQAKEALEQNMDKLRHMMADSGVDVGGANVKQQSNQSSMQEQNSQGSNGQFEQQEEGSLEQSISAQQSKVIKASSTGIDYYA
ncbi:flagellar hook-length control protein FliK [Colwellia sp. RE-S-Sl-9]